MTASDLPVETKQTKATVDWIGQHVVWLATMLWLALVAVKALRVAKMNPQTALAILGSPEVLHVAFFVLLTAVPTLFFALGAAASFWGFDPLEDRGVAKRVAAFSVYLVALTFATAIAPMLNTILLLMFPIGALATYLTNRRQRNLMLPGDLDTMDEAEALLAELENPEASTDPARVADLSTRLRVVAEQLAVERDVAKVETDALAEKLARLESSPVTTLLKSFNPKVFLVVMVASQVIPLSLPLLSSTPWLPPERLSTPSGQQVGYVMGEGEWVVVLAADSRRISRLRAIDLSDRSICQTGDPDSWVSRTAIDVLFSSRTPNYPSCYP